MPSWSWPLDQMATIAGNNSEMPANVKIETEVCGQSTDRVQTCNISGSADHPLIPFPEMADTNTTWTKLNKRQFADADYPQITTAKMCIYDDHP